MTAVETEVESVEDFRLRARAWLAANMPELEAEVGSQLFRFDDEEARLARHRGLQRTLFDGGFAGICFPREYGGQGLPVEYQRAFDEECAGYEMPDGFNVPTLGILAATILDCGTEEQKRRHLPAILRGDELWIQFLSEPSGGSDVAGALTTAVRDGDEWIINGSKVWSTRASHCDYALLLARTNWDVPKHRGLTVFIMKIHQPGVEIQHIEMVDGTLEFCQEFFTDVRLPADSVVGDVDQGWTVATRWMFHERTAVGGGSPYTSGVGGDGAHGPETFHLDLARRVGRIDDPRARELAGWSYAGGVIQDQLIHRVTAGIKAGVLPDPGAAIMRLYRGVFRVAQSVATMELAGEPAVVWRDDEQDLGDLGVASLMRQIAQLGGGSTEMARNVISERVLGMPREVAGDFDRPYREVRTNNPNRR